MLRFFGRGSAFTSSHNSAFFSEGGSLVLTDHSMNAFDRIRRTGADALTESGKAERIYVLVTHTHSDHICGIPLLIHYAYFVWHIPVTVAAPSEKVAEQLRFYLAEMDGCDETAFEIVPADSLKWVKSVIPTEHVPALSGRCFGYQLDVNGRDTVYTGDTRTLEPFLPYLRPGAELYTEAAAVDSGVHLYIADALEQLKKLTDRGVRVFLMHLDDEQRISETIAGTEIRFAELFEG